MLIRGISDKAVVSGVDATTRPTDTSPIKFDTGGCIAVSSQPNNHPHSGQIPYIKLNHFKGMTGNSLLIIMFCVRCFCNQR